MAGLTPRTRRDRNDGNRLVIETSRHIADRRTRGNSLSALCALVHDDSGSATGRTFAARRQNCRDRYRHTSDPRAARRRSHAAPGGAPRTAIATRRHARRPTHPSARRGCRHFPIRVFAPCESTTHTRMGERPRVVSADRRDGLQQAGCQLGGGRDVLVVGSRAQLAELIIEIGHCPLVERVSEP
jgi:hypothetical protein